MEPNYSKLIFILICLLSLSCVARGESAIQGPSPADLERINHPKTPQQTAVAIDVAVTREKPEQIAKFLWARGDEDTKLAHAVAERIIASVEFKKAVLETFPASNLDLRSFGLVEPGDFYSIVASSWKEDGDRATIGNHEGGQPAADAVTMRKVKGVWKLNITPVDESIAEAIDAVQKNTVSIKKLTSQIKSHNLASIDEVRNGLKAAEVKGINPSKPIWPAVVPGVAKKG